VHRAGRNQGQVKSYGTKKYDSPGGRDEPCVKLNPQSSAILGAARFRLPRAGVDHR
jgi:hypothetical protein